MSGWRCFHCDEYFADTIDGRAEARLHFGPTPDETPECVQRRTLSPETVVQRMRQAEWESAQSLANTIGIEEVLERERARLGTALRRLGFDSLDSAVDELTTLRLRLKDADDFSRAVHRQRPLVWEIAMVDVCGPGTYYPPGETKPVAT
jgi:hypothetical protein